MMGMNAIKITAVLSAAALSLCLMTECKVQAKNIVDNGDFKYVISDDGKSAEIISYVGQSLYVSVPDEVNNCAVVSIGAAAFTPMPKPRFATVIVCPLPSIVTDLPIGILLFV